MIKHEQISELKGGKGVSLGLWKQATASGALRKGVHWIYNREQKKTFTVKYLNYYLDYLFNKCWNWERLFRYRVDQKYTLNSE